MGFANVRSENIVMSNNIRWNNKMESLLTWCGLLLHNCSNNKMRTCVTFSGIKVKILDSSKFVYTRLVTCPHSSTLHSFLQGCNPPFLREPHPPPPPPPPPPPFLGPPSSWSKFKKLPPTFWEPSILVHANCKKHFKVKVLCFVLY